MAGRKILYWVFSHDPKTFCTEGQPLALRPPGLPIYVIVEWKACYKMSGQYMALVGIIRDNIL
jgi:hypothetical protein